MDLKSKLHDFEKSFGWTENIRFETCSYLNEGKVRSIQVDTPLFSGARFEVNEANVDVTWPNIVQINFDKLTYIRPGSFKGLEIINLYQ